MKSYGYEKKGEYKKAIKEMLKIEKKEYFYYLRMGWLFYSSKSYRNSLEFYSQALKLKKKSVSAQMGLAYANLALGNNKKAQIILERGWKLTDGNKKVGVKLASIYLQQKKFKDGLAITQHLYGLYPDNITILEYLIIFNQSLKRSKQVKKYVTELTLINPANSLAFSALEEISNNQNKRSFSSVEQEK